MTTLFYDNHLTRWMRENGIPVVTPGNPSHGHGPKPGEHRRVSRRTGLFDAHGHKMSMAALRLKELGGCRLETVYSKIFKDR